MDWWIECVCERERKKEKERERERGILIDMER